jgi:hypothetical protein
MVLPSKVTSDSASFETYSNSVPSSVQFAPFEVPSDSVLLESPMVVPSKVLSDSLSDSVSSKTHHSSVPSGVNFEPFMMTSDCVPFEIPIVAPSEVPFSPVDLLEQKNHPQTVKVSKSPPPTSVC